VIEETFDPIEILTAELHASISKSIQRRTASLPVWSGPSLDLVHWKTHSSAGLLADPIVMDIRLPHHYQLPKPGHIRVR